MSDNPLLTAALRYAAAGIPVVPLHTPTSSTSCSCNRDCGSIGKHPRLMHGLRDATTDPAQIRTWWRMWPAANVGLVTGVTMDVLDIDSQEGLRALLDLVGEGALPGPVVATGSGGWHVWVAPTGCGNRVKMLPGVDWRGTGGYVVAPPSLHASGQRYRWSRPLETARLIACPPALRELVAKPVTEATTTAAVHQPTRYAQAALTGEADKVRQAAEGTRNDTLNRAAYALGRFVGAGMLDRRTVEQELTAAAQAAGLGKVETARTLWSGLNAGVSNPRTVPEPTGRELATAARIATGYPSARAPAPSAHRRTPATRTTSPARVEAAQIG
jgi:hypothetical protein